MTPEEEFVDAKIEPVFNDIFAATVTETAARFPHLGAEGSVQLVFQQVIATAMVPLAATAESAEPKISWKDFVNHVVRKAFAIAEPGIEQAIREFQEKEQKAKS